MARSRKVSGFQDLGSSVVAVPCSQLTTTIILFVIHVGATLVSQLSVILRNTFSLGMPAAAEPEIPQDVSISDELLLNIQRLRRSSSPDLPSTVTKLETAEGCKVYLVGTAHFSKESQDDVEKVCPVYNVSHCT